MDLFEAVKERRSCRAYSPDPVDEDVVLKILEAGTWAPSPLNTQPWEFVVVTSAEVKEKIFREAERCKGWALEKSGWNWLEKYKADFLKSVPVIVAVVGDPRKSGVDSFMEGGPRGYEHGCAAAVQNMLLAAHALGLGSLWFTFFDRANMGEILGVEPEKQVMALVCLGKPAGDQVDTPRKSVQKKTRYL